MDIMMEERKNFVYGNDSLNIMGCVRNGISEDIANQIYDQMIDFAKYAFNKSHAACYAAIAMQTAYLKAHYPKEYYAGLLTSVTDKVPKLTKYYQDCKKKGVPLLLPDVNTSCTDFRIVGNDICYGLSGLKGIGKNAAEAIEKEREEHGAYTSIYDFLRRTYDKVNKKVTENLVKAGAFDSFGHTRRSVTAYYPVVYERIKKEKKDEVDGQVDLFDLLSNMEVAPVPELPVPVLPEFDDMEKLRLEKEVSGMYLSKHPVDGMERLFRHNHILPTSDFFIEDEEDTFRVREDEEVRIGGLVAGVKKVYTKKDHKEMAFVTVEDQYGTVDVVVFPKAYAQYKVLLTADQIVAVQGQARQDSDKAFKVLADQILDLSAWKK